MESTDNSFKPYASPENIVRILARVRKGGVRKVDPEFLIQIGIGEGMIARTLRTLVFLGLIEEDGALTPLFDQYVIASDDESKVVLEGALRRAYDVIFRAADPATDDRPKIHTAFRTMQPSGQWGRMVTLFLGLCQAAGISVKQPPTNRPGKDAAQREKSRPKAKKPLTARVQPSREFQAEFSGNGSRLDPALVGIVGKIADLETADDLESWVAMFRAAFHFVKKIK